MCSLAPDAAADVESVDFVPVKTDRGSTRSTRKRSRSDSKTTSSLHNHSTLAQDAPSARRLEWRLVSEAHQGIPTGRAHLHCRKGLKEFNKKMNKEMQQHQKEMRYLQAESKQLQRLSDQLQRESDQLQRLSDQLQRESDQLQRESDQLQKENDQLQRDIEIQRRQQEKELQQLRTEIALVRNR